MLVLNIGYAKAATTMLQKHIFPNISGVEYLGRYYGGECSGFMKADWVYDFVFEDNISIENCANTILENMVDKDRDHMISHEVLLRPYKKYRVLHRIKELGRYFGGIKLVVSIRNQVDIVLSRSAHDRNIFPYRSIGDALDFEGVTECQWPRCSTQEKKLLRERHEGCACRQAGVKSINVPFYDYLNLYCLMSSLYGADNVHYIVSENLRDNCVDELNRLTRFLGVQSVDSELSNLLSLNRENVQKNKTTYDEARNEFVSSGKKREVFKYFEESNKLLSNVMQLDLGKHGYY